MNFSGKLVIITALAVTVLLVSNIIATKPLSLFTLPFEVLGDKAVIVSVSVICFPLSYIISDVLTEVYGFRVARGVIWLGFACNVIMVILFWLGGAIPGAVFWDNQDAYMAILGTTGWVLLGSFAAYIVGEFANASVMVVLKNKTEGRFLWMRTISSTVVGQGVDSVIFYSIAFGLSGIWPATAVLNGILFAWLVKTAYEIIATPLTYVVVGWLKRNEQMDIYDAPRSLNPFGVFGSGDDGSSYNAARPATTTG
ncbi:MAG: queuosine precursor transporter [Dehalococcoidia bacterium]|nr:queuosine precursor transporter [Dehalococcoidia bacterium]